MIAYKLVPNLGFHDLEHLQPEIYNKVLSLAFRPTTEEIEKHYILKCSKGCYLSRAIEA